MIPRMWSSWNDQTVELLTWGLLVAWEPYRYEESAIIRLQDDRGTYVMVPIDQLTPIELQEE